VTQIVNVESPVHIDEIARRIAEAAYIGRVSEKLKNAVLEASYRASHLGKIRLIDGFCWTLEKQTPYLRNRYLLGSSSKKLDFIVADEIRDAIRHCLKESYGISIHELPKVVVKLLLGFDRLSNENKERISDEIAKMVSDGIITESDDTVSINS
jgi:uncharacterized protein YfeS